MQTGRGRTPVIQADLMTPVFLWLQNCGSCDQCTDLDVNAWLEGPTIVPASLSVSDEGSLNVTFTLLEPGQYRLFVKLLWINGSRAEQGYSASAYLGGQRAGGKSGPFHDPKPQDIQCHENSFLVGSPFDVLANPAVGFPQLTTNSASALGISRALNPASAQTSGPISGEQKWAYELESDDAAESSRVSRAPMPFCTGSDAIRGALREGIWVPAISEGRVSTEQPETCADSPYLVFDSWNPGWIWTGQECSFHLYKCKVLCSKLQEREVERILLIGDSLIREQYVTLQRLLRPCCGSVNVTHLPGSVSVEIEAHAAAFSPQVSARVSCTFLLIPVILIRKNDRSNGR